MKEKSTNSRWTKYYEGQGEPAPQEILLTAIAQFGPSRSNQPPRYAIDLGCGKGITTLALLQCGWQVLAIDKEEIAIALLHARIPENHQTHLTTQQSSFETVTLPPNDLINASYSLSFCHPEHFPAFWNQLSQSIRPGGRFVGQLFGERDTWTSNPTMTFFSRTQAERLFTNAFEIESFREEERDGPSVSGPKHWHVFHMVARKRLKAALDNHD